jgi:hypothetical protein
MEPRIKECTVIICKNRINDADYAKIMQYNDEFCLLYGERVPEKLKAE